MTLERVVREVPADEHADVLREPVRLLVQELMNAEVSELIWRRARGVQPRSAARSTRFLKFPEAPV
jgi:hypothetical protein